MISGLPGTGKSHFARRLAERFPATILETDALRRILFPSPAYSAEENRRLFPAVNRLISDLLREGIPVIYDATNLLEFQRGYVYRIADHAGAKLIIVQSVAPEGVVVQRLDARRRSREPTDLSEATWEVYQKMKATAEPIQRNYFVVDTSRDITPVIEKVLRGIGEGT
ncbi:MAG: ATP-binding protein [Chloroflexi bacterium]|nr:ATP-binding protein [Chloroflexota bacterium]